MQVPAHLLVFCVALRLLVATPCRAQERVVVTYYERPPYLAQGDDGAPTGLTGTPATSAFHHAGVDVTWMMVPTNRQLAMVKDPQLRSCAVGWFRNAERERFARFTKPIYRDKDWVLVAHAGYVAPDDATLAQILHNPATRILVKDSFSYGPEIDAMIARGKPTVAVTTGNAEQMLQSVSAGMVNFMFVSEEEGAYMLSRNVGRGVGLRLLRPRGMPRGVERHIMCGKAVPENVIDRLNKAITFR